MALKVSRVHAKKNRQSMNLEYSYGAVARSCRASMYFQFSLKISNCEPIVYKVACDSGDGYMQRESPLL